MPSAPPIRTRKSLLRRLTAGVLGVVLGIALIAEPLLADVCDGDAPAAARVSVAPHQDLSAVRSVPTTGALIGAVRSVEVTRTERPDVPATPTGSPHDIHVCHCVHAHGGTLGRVSAMSAPPTLGTNSLGLRAERLPPSAALEPPLRPPAAFHAA